MVEPFLIVWLAESLVIGGAMVGLQWWQAALGFFIGRTIEASLTSALVLYYLPCLSLSSFTTSLAHAAFRQHKMWHVSCVMSMPLCSVFLPFVTASSLSPPSTPTGLFALTGAWMFCNFLGRGILLRSFVYAPSGIWALRGSSSLYLVWLYGCFHARPFGDGRGGDEEEAENAGHDHRDEHFRLWLQRCPQKQFRSRYEPLAVLDGDVAFLTRNWRVHAADVHPHPPAVNDDDGMWSRFVRVYGAH
jgi:hypothetical protein